MLLSECQWVDLNNIIFKILPRKQLARIQIDFNRLHFISLRIDLGDLDQIPDGHVIVSLLNS